MKNLTIGEVRAMIADLDDTDAVVIRVTGRNGDLRPVFNVAITDACVIGLNRGIERDFNGQRALALLPTQNAVKISKDY